MKFKPATLQKDFYIKFFIIGVLTFIIHEFFHWFAGTMLGYDMVMTPNRAFSTSPTSFYHKQFISMAGPFITYLQALVGYFLLVKRKVLLGFAMIYMAFFMRFFAGIISIFNPNDEARVSVDLGIGFWTLPSIVIIILFYLLYRSSRHLKLTFKDQLFCYLIASLVLSFIVGIDSMFPK